MAKSKTRLGPAKSLEQRRDFQIVCYYWLHARIYSSMLHIVLKIEKWCNITCLGCAITSKAGKNFNNVDFSLCCIQYDFSKLHFFPISEHCDAPFPFILDWILWRICEAIILHSIDEFLGIFIDISITKYMIPPLNSGLKMEK